MGKKEQNSGFHCGMDEVSAELSSTEDNPRGNNSRKVFVPSMATFTPETVHAVISVIHENVYDIIQIEVSKKKLESSTSVANSSSKAETQPERKETRYFIDLAAPRQIE